MSGWSQCDYSRLDTPGQGMVPGVFIGWVFLPVDCPGQPHGHTQSRASYIGLDAAELAEKINGHWLLRLRPTRPLAGALHTPPPPRGLQRRQAEVLCVKRLRGHVRSHTPSPSLGGRGGERHTDVTGRVTTNLTAGVHAAAGTLSL